MLLSKVLANLASLSPIPENSYFCLHRAYLILSRQFRLIRHLEKNTPKQEIRWFFYIKNEKNHYFPQAN